MTHSRILRFSFFCSDGFFMFLISLATKRPKMSNWSDVFASSTRARFKEGSSPSFTLLLISWSCDLSSMMIVGICFGVDEIGFIWLTYWLSSCCCVSSMPFSFAKRRLRLMSSVSSFGFIFGSSYSTDTWKICCGWAPPPPVATIVVSVFLLLLLIFSDEFSLSSSYFSWETET